MFKHWLSSTPHIGQHALAKVPAEKLVRDAVGIVWQTADGVEYPAIYLKDIEVETDDFVIILNYSNLVSVFIREGYWQFTSGLMDIRY